MKVNVITSYGDNYFNDRARKVRKTFPDFIDVDEAYNKFEEVMVNAALMNMLL